MIVSHNRNFLDPLVTKTLEFRPGEQPVLYAGNITYYLDKSAEDAAKAAGIVSSNKAAAAAAASSGASSSGSSRQSIPGVNRKEQRRIEAEQREIRSKVLRPLENELETLEAKIAELEASQVKLTADLASEEVSSDPDQLRQVTNSVGKVTHSLETCYSRWGVLSDEIEQVKAKLGMTDG
jgi:ATP-binding cassette subfamily F protein 3